MSGISRTLEIVRAAAVLVTLATGLQAEAVRWSEDFETGDLTRLRWVAVVGAKPNRITVESWPGHGRVAHIVAEQGNADLQTRASIGNVPYQLEFSFCQPATENSGYAGVVRHAGADQYAYWWLEWQPPKLRVWTVSKGTWSARWECDGLQCDRFYRVSVQHNPGTVQFTVLSAEGQRIAQSGPLPHDPGVAGPVLFGAHTGGGVRGVVLDDISLEYPAPPPLVKLPLTYKQKAPRTNLQRGVLRAAVSTDRGWLLSLRGLDGSDLLGTGLGRLVVEDVTTGRSYDDADFTVTGQQVTPRGDGVALRQSSGDKLVRLESRYSLENDALVWTVSGAGDFDTAHGAKVRFHLPFPSWCDKVFLPAVGAPVTRESLRPAYTYRDPTSGLCITLATLYSQRFDRGLSVFVEPDTPKSALSFSFDPDGEPPSMQVEWSYLRLERRPNQILRIYLAIHRGDALAGLGWAARRFPQYFKPQVAVAPGHQVISGQMTEERIKEMRDLGFTWEETHLIRVPFYGRYISEENTPEERAKANEYLRRVHPHNFHLYLYWNFMETPPKFASDNFPDSIYTDGSGKQPALGWNYENVWMIPFPGGKWHNYILGQLDAMIAALPGIDGIFADNTLHSCLSYGQDDGHTLVNGRPAYQSAFAQHATLEAAKKRLVRLGKGLWTNPSCDLESARYMDGILVESRADWLEGQQYFGVLKPMVFITYYRAEDPKRTEALESNLRAALRSGTMLGFNEWELKRETIDLGLLRRYLPLFEPLRGREWVLEPHSLSLPPDILGNLFRTAEGGYFVPLLTVEGAAARELTVEVSVRDAARISGAFVYDINAGAHWSPVRFERKASRLQVRVGSLSGAGGLWLRTDTRIPG